MNKKILIFISGVLGFILVSDVIKLCVGYSYTWLGFITMIIDLFILGIVFDTLEI